MLNRLIEVRDNQRAERENTESGFTLIELLVVVVIIGILIAIAIPLYLNYQKGAANKSAASDTRNAVAAVEQCRSDNGSYPATGTQSPTTGGKVTFASCTDDANVSDGNTMTYTFTAATSTVPASYTVATKAGSPGSATYTYSSTTGKTATT